MGGEKETVARKNGESVKGSAARNLSAAIRSYLHCGPAERRVGEGIGG